MIKIDDHASVDLDQLANDFYEFLNPKENGNYITHSLIRRIERQKTKDTGNVDRIRFWDFLLASSYTKLKEIITGRPDNLALLDAEIKALVPHGFFSDEQDYENATVTEFGEIVKTVFNYRSLYRNKKECAANCRQFSLKYCPYCNETPVPVITIIDNMIAPQDQALNQLDHFFPKSRHPYFSLSFFNLVPGCGSCNGPLKGEKKFQLSTHFHPFYNRFDDLFFFEVNTVTPKSPEEITICVSNKSPFPDNGIRDFRLINRYNETHKPIIFGMLSSLKAHSPKIRRSLLQQFAGLFQNLETTKKALMMANGIPIQKKDINNYHIGKLKRDIATKLGLL